MASLPGLNKYMPGATTRGAKRHQQRQIEATDQEIDGLVYELYGLTEKEIAIVEGRDHRMHRTAGFR